MKRVYLWRLGVGLMVASLLVALGSTVSLTGFSIIDKTSSMAKSSVALILLIGAIVLLILGREEEGGLDRKIEKTKHEIENALRSGKIGTTRELVQMAHGMRYNIKGGGKHPIHVYQGDHRVAVIPHHPGDLKKGTYRGILKDLYDGYDDQRRVA